MTRKSFAGVLVGFLVAGCGTRGVTPSAIAPAAEASARPLTGPFASPDCYGVNESVNRIPNTIDTIAPDSTAIVVARVDAREPRQWFWRRADRSRGRPVRVRRP